MFGTIWLDFDMSARVMTLWYFLQGIIEICCFELRQCARMVFYARDEGRADTGSPDDMQKMGWNACVSALLCNLHIPRGNR